MRLSRKNTLKRVKYRVKRDWSVVLCSQCVCHFISAECIRPQNYIARILPCACDWKLTDCFAWAFPRSVPRHKHPIAMRQRRQMAAMTPRARSVAACRRRKIDINAHVRFAMRSLHPLSCCSQRDKLPNEMNKFSGISFNQASKINHSTNKSTHTHSTRSHSNQYAVY